jgi:isopentenyl diphosphate isomerase/L-lactate dehydrogenase-like FMN-dependent dehydrogenase
MRPIDDCYNVFDLRDAARKRLPKCVFEFIDRGTEDEVGIAENRAAFNRLKLRTKFMVDLTHRDMSIDLFGKPCSMPVAIAPTGAAGLCWYLGELELAKAAAKAGIPFTLTTASITSMDTIAKEAGGRLWYQLYMWKETHYSYEMVGRARDLGFEALVVTIDSAAGRNREYNHRNGFTDLFSLNRRAVTDMLMHPGWLTGTMMRYLMTTGAPRHENYPEKYRHRITRGRPGEEPQRYEAMTWRDIEKLRAFWPGILIVKSVLSPEDARMAVESGADGIVVSNHVGRALDSAIATTDLTTGDERFTFGIPDLAEGVDFVAVAVGLFAFGEIITHLGSPANRPRFDTRVKGLLPTGADLKRSWKPILRGTFLGAFLGIFPGTGPLLSSFASYAMERRMADDPSRFGNGAIEGVAGPEAANNAAAITHFIPMLTLGIPAGAAMALMLGALQIQGITPGPEVVSKHPDLFWGVIASMWIGNLMLLVLNLPMIGIWPRLLLIPFRFLYPAILAFCCIGVFSVNNATFDVLLAVLFGVLGVVFKALDCNPAPLVLALALEPLLEQNFRRAMILSDGDVSTIVTQPISLGILVLTAVLTVFFAMRKQPALM